MRIDNSGQRFYEAGDKVVINFDTYPQEHVHEIECLRGQIGIITLTRGPDQNSKYQITPGNPNGNWQPTFYQVDFGAVNDQGINYFNKEELILIENG